MIGEKSMNSKGKENTWTVIGNAGRDAEVKATKSGQLVKFSCATEQGFGESAEALWFNVVQYSNTTSKTGQYAFDIANSVKKGDKIFARGYVQLHKYDKTDGTQGFELNLVADYIINLSQKREGSAAPASPRATANTESLYGQQNSHFAGPPVEDNDRPF
jgi:single-stranded DNA-binding protein